MMDKIFSKEKKNKNKDYTELNDSTKINNSSFISSFVSFGTSEQEKKIIPKEVENLNYILNNHNSMNKFTWEIEGESVLIKY